MVNGADPAGQQLVAHVREPGRSHAGRERLGVRKGLHRLWQVGIGIPMFGHRAPDRREHPAEVEQIGRAQRREARSEEHTSELQSPCNLVCRLLLEKKKKNTTMRVMQRCTEQTQVVRCQLWPLDPYYVRR